LKKLIGKLTQRLIAGAKIDLKKMLVKQEYKIPKSEILLNLADNKNNNCLFKKKNKIFKKETHHSKFLLHQMRPIK
jgi:hypothetical protein